MATPEPASRNPRGASTTNISWKAVFYAWRVHHLASAADSLHRLLLTPLQNLMTVLVIGITLALPTLFGIALENLQTLGRQWDGVPRVSLFLKTGIAADEIDAIRKKISTAPGVVETTLVTPEDGLAEFEKQAGIEGTLELLDKNPLPPVLIASFANSSDPDQLDALQTQWQTLPGVEVVQADLAWVNKLRHLLELGSRIVVGLAVMLGVGALLSVGNTIRLAIENRRSEIVVAKLVGATDAFVRRPFLYTGFWYGACGGIIAIVLVMVGYHWLVAPVAALALLYESGFTLQGLSGSYGILLFLTGITLGVIGAWLAVAQHLHSMRPR